MKHPTTVSSFQALQINSMRTIVFINHGLVLQALEDLYVHYDQTVRNAASGIVQFTYGDDGMDPVTMEGKDGQPLDFKRTLAKVGWEKS